MTGIAWLLVATLVAVLAWSVSLKRVSIAHGEVGLLYRNGRLQRTLAPGRHRWIDPLGSSEVVRVSILPQTLSTAALEVMSRDQFAFRVTVSVLGTVSDPQAMHEGTPKPFAVPGVPAALLAHGRYDRLHPVLSAAVLQAAGALTLEEFLANPTGALTGVQDSLAPVLPGTAVDAVLVTSVTLPPEVRKMFTEVERARREGLAQLERARGEQAALRALANAARNLADNPQLAQLRMLQTMENAKGAKTFVLGHGGDDGKLAAGMG